MIQLWLHTVTLSFLKCFIPSACYRLCNIRPLSLSPQTDLISSVTSTEKLTRQSFCVFVRLSQNHGDVFQKGSYFSVALFLRCDAGPFGVSQLLTCIVKIYEEILMLQGEPRGREEKQLMCHLRHNEHHSTVCRYT